MHDKEGVFGGALWCVVSWVWSVLNFEMEFLGLGGGVPVERWSERDREVGVRVGLLLMWVIMQSGQVSERLLALERDSLESGCIWHFGILTGCRISLLRLAQPQPLHRHNVLSFEYTKAFHPYLHILQSLQFILSCPHSSLQYIYFHTI